MSVRQRAVALHDVQPRSYRRCAEIREWLHAMGVGPITLLVIPAPGMHSFARRSPALHDWLHERVDEGDGVAQHGLLHDRGTRRCGIARETLAWFQGGTAAEFAGLARERASERVQLGQRILLEAGFDARGFVAPGYAYSPGLREHLAREFDWYADLTHVYRRGGAAQAAPAYCLGTRGFIRRPLSPLAARGLSAFARETVRIDIHPEDFDHKSHKRALERMLRRTELLPAVVYDELARA